jgi:hypothetical protein
MPYLSQFYGIIITMNSERGAKHNDPHFHARYGNDKLVVSTGGEIIAGKFPLNNKKWCWHGQLFMKMNLMPLGNCWQLVYRLILK